MGDRELLELAAIASGLRAAGRYDFQLGLEVSTLHNSPYSWNPLGDDSDAFRLAHKLGIQIKWFGSIETVRRAIVSAAAEIGKNML